MKTLIIVRHGKSSWDDARLQDFERPLLETGENRSKITADYLLAQDIKPDLILSSHAVRAFETASLLASKFNYPRHKIQVESQIYHKGTEGIWSLVFSLPDEKNQVLLVGHNPTLTQFVNGLLDRAIDYLPTSAAVSITFFTDRWSELLMAQKKIDFVAFPEQLKKST